MTRPIAREVAALFADPEPRRMTGLRTGRG